MTKLLKLLEPLSHLKICLINMDLWTIFMNLKTYK